MINYRVENLDQLLDQLRSAGVEVDDRVEEYEYGRFAWIMDRRATASSYGNRRRYPNKRLHPHNTIVALSPGGVIGIEAALPGQVDTQQVEGDDILNPGQQCRPCFR